MDSALNAIGARWVNHPRCNRRAEDKPANLRRAAALGLDTPDWLVTNDPEEAQAFAARHEAIVGKAVESAYVGTGRALWTRRIDDRSWLERIGPEPYLLQRFIDKKNDVRVTIVGDDHFAVAIDSQATAASSIDLRAGRLTDLRHRQIKLPDEISSRIHELTAELGLRFAAIDLVVDADDRHWFLELNPNGQWAWLEECAQVPIADAIVGVLT
jgi:glutathione synthase/RimK-type ligase-like ATP-grasp enzyme